jgi:hypothetical protein
MPYGRVRLGIDHISLCRQDEIVCRTYHRQQRMPDAATGNSGPWCTKGSMAEIEEGSKCCGVAGLLQGG